MQERYIETAIDNFKFKEMKYSLNITRELLANAKYKNYNFYIYNLGNHPTAYVEIPKESKLYKKEHNDINIDVHGGLTYSDDCLDGHYNSWFIGWDYAHFDDYTTSSEMFLVEWDSIGKKWTTREILEEVFNVIDQIIKIEKDAL